MGRKEATLPLSTVASLAIAAFVGHLLLDSESSPLRFWPSPISELAEEDVSPFEVPSMDAGRAFERQQGTPSEANQHPKHAASSHDSPEELQPLWDEAVSRMSGQAEAYGPTASALVLAMLLGIASFMVDAKDAVLEEEWKPKGKPRSMQVQELPKVSGQLPVNLFLIAGLAIAVFSGLACSPATSLPTAAAPINPPQVSELDELLSYHSQSTCDALVAAAFLVSLLLGLQAAFADVCEMQAELEKEQQLHDKVQVPPTTAASSLQPVSDRYVSLRVLCCTLGAAAAVSSWLAGMAWITGSHPPSPEAGSPAKLELLSMAAAAVTRSFSWAAPDEATSIALAACSFLGVAAACKDMQEEADSQRRELELRETESSRRK